MKTHLVMTALGVATLVLGAAAQSYDLTLQHTDIETIPAQARAAYEDAVDALDHQDTVGAVRSLARAAELAPEAAEIQIHFVTMVRESVRPDSFGLDATVEVTNKAIDAYERIISDEQVPDWAKQIAQRELGELMELIDNIDAIYRERQEAGSAWIQAYADLQERWRVQREREERALRERRMQQATTDGSATAGELFQEARQIRNQGANLEDVKPVSYDVDARTEGVQKVD